MDKPEQTCDMEKLPPELKLKLLEVEIAAEAEERKNIFLRFNKAKALPIGAACAIISFIIGMLLRSGTLNSLIFAMLMCVFGCITAGFQRVKK